MNRRLIIIISLIIVILAGLGGLLFFATKKQSTPKVVQTSLQMKKVLDEQVIAPVASFDGNAIWYFNSQGELFRANVDGSGLSEFPLPTLTSGTIRDALWPKTGSDFIAITGSGTNEIKNYYSNAKNAYTSLPANVQSLDWMPDSMRVLYIWKSSDNLTQQLVMADADGTGFTTIANVFWPDLQVKAGPDGKTALLYRSNIQGDTNKIYLVDLSSGQISTVVWTGKNIDAMWLPSGKQFIYAQNQVAGYPKLYLYDLTAQTSTDLNLTTTLDKITFDSTGQTLYAAVPKSDNTGDIFITENLQTLQQTPYFTPPPNVAASGLLLIGDALYFTNTSDLKFYSISK